MRMLLRAKMGCDERKAFTSLISPPAVSVNWISASPLSMPCRAAPRGKPAPPILLAKLDHTTAADMTVGAGGAAGAVTGGATGAIATGAAGGAGVGPVIRSSGGGGVRTGTT